MIELLEAQRAAFDAALPEPLSVRRDRLKRAAAMVRDNADPFRTAYTITVDAAQGVTTGISAADRAHTANLLANPDSTASDFTRPGHMFPLIAKPGGVRERDGHTEAGVEFARLAGFEGGLANAASDLWSLLA